jgi:uncharacterized damage-inducible protein DinB
MSLEKLMHNYADYNLWANQTLTDWLSTKPAALLGKNVPSSYPSLAKTLSHLWDTEKFWLAVLQGSARQPWAEFNGSDEEVITGLLRQSEAFCAYVKTLDEAALLEPCHLDATWLQGYMPKYEFIQHCINHGAYHRGQVITIARNLGITDPPMTDYNYYNMGVKAKK